MGTWDDAGRSNLFFEMRPRRRAAALMAALFGLLTAVGCTFFPAFLSGSDQVGRLSNGAPDIFALIFVSICTLVAGYMLVMYLIWALGRVPMLTLDQEAFHFRPAPWYERVVRWEDVERVEVRAIANGPILPGLSFSRTRITLRVRLRPEARGRYLHRRWLTFRTHSSLLPISVADLAATIEDFATVERRAFWL